MPGSFADHQWQRLVEAAPAIALGVAAASGNAGQSVAELEAFLRLVDQTANESEGDSILGRLAIDIRSKIASGMLGGDTEDAMAGAIHAAREAGAILGVAADEQESRVLRQWLLRVAYTVAGAVREGRVLGFGGDELSARERETMSAIADGLGAQPEGEAEAESEAEAEVESAVEEPEREERASGDPARAERQVGPDGQPIGPKNIAEGRVRGVMGGPNPSEGEGQGG